MLCLKKFFGENDMAFDGITVANIVSDLNTCLRGGRIYKIYQPEADELNIVVKTAGEADGKKGSVRLLLSASASLPLVYLTEDSKTNPMTAPNFCMLLRKHIGNGRIIRVSQPGLERIIIFEIAHLDEMGDMRTKRLIVEIMGKHSNIIFVDEGDMIIDSIKHIGAQVSSVREVLPGRMYVLPPAQDKLSPFAVDEAAFGQVILAKPMPVAKAVYTSFVGFSPVMGQELCHRSGIDGGLAASALKTAEVSRLWRAFSRLVSDIKEARFMPAIYMEDEKPREFSSVTLSMYGDLERKEYASISEALHRYYAMKDTVTRIRQKSSDLRRIVSTAVERVSRKYDLQRKQLADTDKRDKYRIYGELLNTYGYSVEPGAKSFPAVNYYDGSEIIIPLDDALSALDNAKKYFAKYNKLKRTYEALTELVEESRAELHYLLSVQNALEIALTEADLKDIKSELTMAGYIRQRHTGGKTHRTEKSRPMHFLSSDGFDIYVGKNNLQNDELSFQLASANDLWFHAKQMPGSHVIVKLLGAEDIPDATYEEAGRLAAYFSAGRENKKVEIDYTRRQQLKKPAGAKPGYVIYHTNYSMVSEPDIRGIAVVSM